MDIQVHLRAAKIPFVGLIAVHYWFVVIRDCTGDRWEVWQTPNLASESWGHLHKNLMPAESGVGNGKSWLAVAWTGQQADQLAFVIENSPITYPYISRYCYFPGPNSNTYAQWVLQQASNPYRLGRKGIGKRYPLIGLEKTKFRTISED